MATSFIISCQVPALDYHFRATARKISNNNVSLSHPLLGNIPFAPRTRRVWNLFPGTGRVSSTDYRKRYADSSPRSAGAGASPENKFNVRFTPKGYQLDVNDAHIAIHGWLFARSTDGCFALGNDFAPSNGVKNDVLEDLDWLGLTTGQGPSHGVAYSSSLETLIASEKVYRCFSSDEELASAGGVSPWATASEDDVDAELAKKSSFTYRFHVAAGEEVTIRDVIKGEMTSSGIIPDFVVWERTGQPSALFQQVVDDSESLISHVFRSEEDIVDSYSQSLVHHALGNRPPIFCHLSPLRTPNGNPAVKLVREMREEGVTPASLANHLASSNPSNPLLTVDQLASQYSIHKLANSSFLFDESKLRQPGRASSQTQKSTAVTSQPVVAEDSPRGNVGLALATVLGAVLLFVGTRLGAGDTSLRSLAASSVPYEEALSNGRPTLVEFYADWCQVCQEESSDIYSVEQQFKDKVNFVMLNIDNPKWAEELDEFGVQGIPHFVFLDGKQNEMGYVVGRLPRNILEVNLDALSKAAPSLPYSEVVGQFSNKEEAKRAITSSDPRSHG